MIDLKITGEPLDISGCVQKMTDPECGGMVIFTGMVRNKTMDRPVDRLEYEAYESMALKECKKIAEDAVRSWDIKNILIHHRTGPLQIGDIAVIIIVSAPHRDAAFKACRYTIDALKQTVPIWKKEIFQDGEEWVSAHA